MNLVETMKNMLRKKSELPQSVVTLQPTLSARLIRANGQEKDCGVLSRRCVTTAFTAYLCQCFATSATYPLDVFKYHDAGTGTGGEATSDSALGTAWGGARATGVNTYSGNVMTSIATIAFTAAKSITEQGIFSATTSGTLLDRSSFAAIGVSSGDSIAFTYQLTCTAGG